MQLSERKRKLLKAIIEGYIDTAEPVSSKAVTEKWNHSFSSATIRNEMSELEELGLLEKPHTSAGRVPSQAGYRMYVDELMNDYQLTVSEIERINAALTKKVKRLDEIVAVSGRIISELTDRPTVAISPKNESIVVKRFEIVPIDLFSFVLILVTDEGIVKNHFVKLDVPVSAESAAAVSRLFNTFLAENRIDETAIEKMKLIHRMSGPAYPLSAHMSEFFTKTVVELYDTEVFLTGASKILDYPEYKDPEKARRLIEFLSDKSRMNAVSLNKEEDSVGIAIGDEISVEEMKDSSMIYGAYRLPGGHTGIVAVVGPIRMDYSKTAATVDAFIKGLKKRLENRQDDLWDSKKLSPHEKDNRS